MRGCREQIPKSVIAESSFRSGENMKWAARAIVALILPGLPAVGMAQQVEGGPKRVIRFTTEADELAAKQNKAAEEAERERAFYAYPVGKTFWYKPGSSMRKFFYQRMKATSAGISVPDGRITPTSTVSFKVLEVFEYMPRTSFSSPYYAYRIEFEDGSPAFVDGSAFGYYYPGAPLGGDRQALTDQASAATGTFNSKLFTVDPEKLAAQDAESKAMLARLQQDLAAAEEAGRAALEARDKAKRATAAREYKRKGGVKLGMTAAQVRASNWGAPVSVNRTTGAFGVHEQWVYENDNYLYFENGVLTTIQN
jgi:hypothetical protein